MRGNGFHFIFERETVSKPKGVWSMVSVLRVPEHTHSRVCKLGTSSLDGIIRCSLTKSVLTHSATDVTSARTVRPKTTGSGWKKSMDGILSTNSFKKDTKQLNTQSTTTKKSPRRIEINFLD